MLHEHISKRRRRGLSKSKAKKILHEGLSSAGNGFHSEKQRRYIAYIADGGTPTKTKTRKRKKRGS